MYINAQEDSRHAVTGPLNVSVHDVSAVGGNPVGSSPFHGRIDEVVIYNQALASHDIAQVMAGVIQTRPAPRGLMATPVSFSQIDLAGFGRDRFEYRIYRMALGGNEKVRLTMID